MLRGGTQHNGFVAAEVKPPFRLAWTREFEGERLGTAMEPIVAGGNILVATHRGNLYCLREDSGEANWRFQAHGAFLHSPAVAGELVVAGNTDGYLYAVARGTGELQWRYFAGYGGMSASPVAAGSMVFVGTRQGDFLAVSTKDGRIVWRQSVGAPMRQTAAVAGGSVYVTAEDLRVRCFRAADGKPIWVSTQLSGQTVRDYYPVVVTRNGRTTVIVRTNPILNMGQRISRDRALLCRNAGVDDSSWQKLDGWTKSDDARGRPELWDKEQATICQYLETNRDAQTFFVLDGETGKEALTTPVFWIAGCQGVGAPPALTGDGRLLVFYRCAYGNWNHGVAPLVALGLLDLEQNRITPLFHQQGAQPRWNCFWGTADESQSFVTVGDTVLITHQGTLSGFDLKRQELFPIWGERDTYGGFRNPPWARNEWHGPGRSGVAVADGRLYWQTGSRILCLTSTVSHAEEAKPATQRMPGNVRTIVAPEPEGVPPGYLSNQLATTVQVLLDRAWAPLFTDPGLAGRIFSFDRSADLLEALAWAYPHLSTERQHEVKTHIRQEWTAHPPFAATGVYSLHEGEPREWFAVPVEYRARLGGDKQPHPFGSLYSIWRVVQRCGEERLVEQSWPQLLATFEDFVRSGWQLDATKGDPFANRYLSSLMAQSHLAERFGTPSVAQQTKAKAAETSAALVAWWKRAAKAGTLKTFKGSAELDPFIGKGDGLFLAIAPHRHTIALFDDLTPEVADLLRNEAPEAVAGVWRAFTELCPTWDKVSEERQVHFGENFVDSPPFSLGAFKGLAWLAPASAEELARKVDLPFCRADLDYVTKIAIALDSKP